MSTAVLFIAGMSDSSDCRGGSAGQTSQVCCARSDGPPWDQRDDTPAFVCLCAVRPWRDGGRRSYHATAVLIAEALLCSPPVAEHSLRGFLASYLHPPKSERGWPPDDHYEPRDDAVAVEPVFGRIGLLRR
ncbi:hypothetical protein MRX96_041559 [Rhipicephalus microplus]